MQQSVNGLVADGFLLHSDGAEILAEAAALDVWSSGSCWAGSGVDESGPASSVLGAHRAEHAPLGFAVPGTMATASCTLAGAGL